MASVRILTLATSYAWGRDEHAFGQKADDVWAYDVRADRLTRLTVDGATTIEHAPAVRSATEFSFAVRPSTRDYREPSTVYSVRITGSDERERRKLFTAAGRVVAQAWSPDGNMLAFIAWYHGDDTNDGLPTLYLYEAGNVRKLREMTPISGREYHQGDEARVSWSPDGTMIVAGDSAAAEENLLVVRLDGSDVVTPRQGSFARLTPGAASLIYRAIDDDVWYVVDFASGARRTLPIPDQRALPSLSPDGRTLAYSDWSSTNSVYLFDIATGEERRLASNAAAPIWLDGDTIAYSVTEPCLDNHTGESACVQMSDWEVTGAVRTIRPDGEGRRAITLITTVGAGTTGTSAE